MRLTNYSDYALRTLMYLAVVPDSNSLATITDIANSYQISRSHLTKIIHQLAKIGYIDSIRGKNGGIRLAQDPKQINLGEVIRHTEPDFEIVPCFMQELVSSDTSIVKNKSAGSDEKRDVPCTITPVCHLKSVFAEATQAFLNVMDNYTLADIVSNKNDLWQILKVNPSSITNK